MLNEFASGGDGDWINWKVQLFKKNSKILSYVSAASLIKTKKIVGSNFGELVSLWPWYDQKTFIFPPAIETIHTAKIV